MIRPAIQGDLDTLGFLAIAGYEPDAEPAKSVAFVATHLAGRQRPQDFGFIAERDATPIGAAWARQFVPDEQPAFCVDDRIRRRRRRPAAMSSDDRQTTQSAP